jgi:hypothetical protein
MKNSGVFRKAFLGFFLLVSGMGLYALDRGLVVLGQENLGSSAGIGKQYLLFIAIDAYRSWPALKNPVADAKEIRNILVEDYYVNEEEIIELYNKDATKERIIETFENLQKKLTVHDSLFIYYAGHGHLDEASRQGFWIPVDAGTNRRSQENWLPNSQVRGYITGLKTIHVFLVSDACFSGDILNTTRALPPQIDNAYYRRAYSLTSRQVLTSGSSETVPDYSEFADALKNCLRKNVSPLLDPISIYNDVRLAVQKTTPLYGTLNAANHQEGATFLFFSKQGRASQVAVIPPPSESRLPESRPPESRPSESRPSTIPLPSEPPASTMPGKAPGKPKTSSPDKQPNFWSLGGSMGTSFAAPWVIGTIRGTIAPFRYSFLELGFDIGLMSGDANVGYYSLYPFAHYAIFVPFAEKGGWYIGAGGGYMNGEYDFDGDKVSLSIFAGDFVTGINIMNVFDISYTLRTDFGTVSNKVSLGYTYRFK